MPNKTIERHLLSMSILALGYTSDTELNLDEFIYSIEFACQQRKIIGPVQFEDYWQSYINDNPTPQLLLQFKFSPPALRNFQCRSEDMHQFSWELVLPNINYFSAHEKPTDSVEYLLLGFIQYKSRNCDESSDESVLAFIEEVSNSLRI
jgi:hypothetical protein